MPPEGQKKTILIAKESIATSALKIHGVTLKIPRDVTDFTTPHHTTPPPVPSLAFPFPLPSLPYYTYHRQHPPYLDLPIAVSIAETSLNPISPPHSVLRVVARAAYEDWTI